jgi:hypothetical protein
MKIKVQTKGKSSIFTAEILCRNGLVLFCTLDFSGGSAGEGYFGRAFLFSRFV